jgi:hypothetical protein
MHRSEPSQLRTQSAHWVTMGEHSPGPNRYLTDLSVPGSSSLTKSELIDDG